MMPFWQWKNEQVKKDSEAHGVFRFYRPRDWYHRAYGLYVLKESRKNDPHQRGSS